MNQRRKGARGELEVAKLFASYGFTARRGSQASFASDDPDVICPELEALGYRIEVKIYGEFLLDSKSIRTRWAEKAAKDIAKSNSPAHRCALFHRTAKRDWVVWVTDEDVFYLADTWLTKRQEEVLAL